MRTTFCVFLVALAAVRLAVRAHPPLSSQDSMDRDLMEITIPQLEQLYSSHKYTVTDVARWHTCAH